jgi:hypothetical protein
VGAAWRQPSYSPRRRPPAVTVMAWSLPGSAALHRPLGAPQPVQLRRDRPGAVLQVLQVAVAVERPPVDAARPAAPVAGLRGAWTGIVGLRPAAAFVALPEPGSGSDADLPRPAGLPAGHQLSPPLAWLPGSDQPAKPAGTAQPEPHGASTVLPGDSACWARAGAAGDPRAREPACPPTVRCPDARSRRAAPYACASPGLAGLLLGLADTACGPSSSGPLRHSRSQRPSSSGGLDTQAVASSRSWLASSRISASG